MSRVFAALVGLGMLGGNAWLGLRRPTMRPMALMNGFGGFAVLWFAVVYGRWTKAVAMAPLVAWPFVIVAVVVWTVRRERRRARRPPPGNVPRSPGP